MTDIEIKILVSKNEYEHLLKTAKEHKSCSDTNSKALQKSGDGVHNAGDNSSVTNPVKNGCKCEIINSSKPDIDQRAESYDKIIVQPTDQNELSSDKSNYFERVSEIDYNLISNSVRKRYHVKTEKLLKALKKYPNDVSYDVNGMLSFDG